MPEKTSSSPRRTVSLPPLEQSRPLGLAVATAVSAVVLATSGFLVLPGGRAQTAAGPTPAPAAPAEPHGTVPAAPAAGWDPSPARLDLQRQVNELRSDLLDERERRVARQMAVNAAALVLLGIVVGVGGLWFYARFQAIAVRASIGAAEGRHYVFVPPGQLSGPATLREPSSEALQPLPLPLSAGLKGEPVTTGSANGNSRASPQEAPRFHAFRRTLSPEDRGLDDADLHRLEETIADCTEAIRVDPDSPRLYLERAGARSKLDRYEEAVADYDRAIGIDSDNAAAYLGRCHAKSELGRYEEAIEDYDRAVDLDPASASVSGNG